MPEEDVRPGAADRCHPPLPTGRWPRRRSGRLTLHLGFLLALGLAWLVDRPLYEIADSWYNGPDEINGELHQLILSMAMYGQALGFGTAFLLIWLFDRRRRGRIALVASLLLATGAGSSLGKLAFGRQRPAASHGATVLVGPTRSTEKSDHQSFPSGHTGSAVALSYGLASLYPPARGAVWAFAAGCGFNRVVTVRHYLSDVVAGAWLGYAVSEWMLRRRGVWRLCVALSALLAPGRRREDWRTRWDRTLRPAGVRLATSPWTLAAACLLLYWSGNAATELMDRDEPRFATATREMMARGDWITPTFNGELRPDKPIAVYWLMGLAYEVFGPTPFAARLWSGLAATGAVLLCLRLGTAMFDRRVGLLGAWMLAVCPMLVAEAKLATVDALLLCCTTATLYGIWRLVAGSRHWGHAALVWTGLAVGLLVKGPVAVAIPLVAAVGYCLWSGRCAWLASLRPVWGLAWLVLLTLPWVVLVQEATDGDFLAQAVGRHVVHRAVAPMENHAGFPGFYLLTLLMLMSPWAILLPGSVRTHWRGLRERDGRLVFLAAWALGTFVLFELVRTKLVHYCLPAYPALTLFVAAAVLDRRGDTAALLKPLRRSLLLGGVAVLVLVPVAAWAVLPGVLRLPLLAVALVAGGGAVIGARLLALRDWRPGLAATAATAFVTLLMVGNVVLPVASRLRTTHAAGARLAELAGAEAVVAYRYRDPSFHWALARRATVVDNLHEKPPFFDTRREVARHGAVWGAFRPRELHWLQADPALDVDVVETVTALALSRMAERDVHLVRITAATGASVDDPTYDATPPFEHTAAKIAVGR